MKNILNRNSRRFGAWRGRLALAFAVMVLLGSLAHAQFKLGGGFRRLVYYEDNSEAAVRTNRLKTLIAGREAEVLPNFMYLVKEIRIESYALDGSTNLVAKAPQCYLHRNETALSTNRLELEAADGQLHISGRGFVCQLTNFTMTISNDVETVIRSDLLKSARASKAFTSESGLGGSRAPAATGETNTTIHIRADRLHLDGQSNVVTYTGNVRVVSPQLEMMCRVLTIRRSTNGHIESVIAEEDVAITSSQASGTAHGEKAVYSWSEDGEQLILDGQPARWSDGARDGEAGRFTFYLKSNRLQAEQNAIMRLPRASLSQSDWLAAGSQLPRAEGNVETNRVQISAHVITVQFPSTNQPARSVLAQTNVVILNSGDGSRAGADRAFYSEAAGTVELFGNAVWESQQQIIKGDSLFLDRTNQIFRADGEAYLKIPVASMARRSAPGTPPAARTSATNQLPQFIEVFSESYDYQGGLLRFRDHIRVNLLDGDVVNSRLSCGLLTIKASNQIERVMAERDVVLEQTPVSEGGKMVEKNLRCQWLLISVATNGTLEQIVARTNVVAQQTEIRFDQPIPLLTTLNAEYVLATFLAYTNQLESVLAEDKVLVRQNDKAAQGDRAIYTATNDIVELSGHPSAVAPEGRITEAEVLVWDRRANRFYVRQMRAKGAPDSNAANVVLPVPNF